MSEAFVKDFRPIKIDMHGVRLPEFSVEENKANVEKHETKSFATKEIFTYSDYLVDSMTSHIDRERKKKSN